MFKSPHTYFKQLAKEPDDKAYVKIMGTAFFTAEFTVFLHQVARIIAQGL